MMKKIGSYVGISILFLLILVWGTSKLADHYVLSRWNTEDSAVVIIEEVLGIKSDPAVQDEDWESERVMLRLLYRNGQKEDTVEDLEIVRLKDSRLLLMEGEEYLLLSDVFDDGTVQYSISDRYRLPAVVGFIMFACGMLAIIAGKSGIKALAGLFLSLLFLLGWFVPRLASGYPPVPFAIFSVAFISLITVFFVVRKKELWPIPCIGAVGGALGASITGWVMVRLWQLTGLESDSAALLSSTSPDLSLQGLLLAAVMVGAIGAVLDVAVSVTSAMSELYEYDPCIPLKRLWKAGINVGRDVLGSMINTLILAYLGSSLPFVVLIATEGADFIGLLNDPHIAQEILRSVSGTVGLLLTITVTAAAGTWWIRYRCCQENKEPGDGLAD
ncbi:MAG: YibE/F family protein [Synergistaceae bacterium]|nr:YibE/F family protein [Synergistaceae bacterium]